MILLQSIEKFSKWRSFNVSKDLVRGDVRNLKLLCIYLRNPKVENITVDQVIEYLYILKKYGWDDNTLEKVVTSFRKFFEFLKRHDFNVLDFELIPRPKRKYRVPRVAKSEHIQKLLEVLPINSCDPRTCRNRAILKLLIDTGARVSEILELDIEDIDLDNHVAHVRTLKSRGRRPFREIMWTERTNKSLKEWLNMRTKLNIQNLSSNSGPIFIAIPRRRFAKKCGTRLTRNGVNQMLIRASKIAGVPHINAHSLRHKLAHDIIKAGGSGVDVMNIHDHSSLSSTTIYTQMYGNELKERYDSLGVRK